MGIRWRVLGCVAALLLVGQASSFAAPGEAAARCDGRWHVVPSGLGGTTNTPLYGVSGISKNDVWAVGRHGLRNGGDRALILHWNGFSWTSAAVPDVSYTEWLFAVD